MIASLSLGQARPPLPATMSRPMSCSYGLFGAKDLLPARQSLLGRAESTLAALHTKFEDAPVDTGRRLNMLRDELTAIAQGHQGLFIGTLHDKRGGVREIDHAIRAFDGSHKQGDIGSPVADDPAMASLCALVHHAIDHYEGGSDAQMRAREQENMRYGLYCALAQYVETERNFLLGSRHTEAMRLLQVLQGYYAEVKLDEPEQFFPTTWWPCEAVRRKHASSDVHNIIAEAKEVFGDDGPKMSCIEEQSNMYVRFELAR